MDVILFSLASIAAAGAITVALHVGHNTKLPFLMEGTFLISAALFAQVPARFNACWFLA